MLHLICSVGYNNLSVKQKIFYINPDLGNFTPPLPPLFPIYGQFGAIGRPDFGSVISKTYMLITSNLSSYKNQEQS